MESTGSRLKVSPAPGRIVVRPFDLLSANSKLHLPDSVSAGKTTTGIVIAVNRREVSDALPDDFIAPADDSFVQVGMQVIFAAFAGTDVIMNEPLPDKPQNRQRYVVIRESDVIAAIEFDGTPAQVHAEPRSIGA